MSSDFKYSFSFVVEDIFELSIKDQNIRMLSGGFKYQQE